jgi:hypothetical protein
MNKDEPIMEKSLVKSQVPVLADAAMSLSLDGAWSVRRWPFAVPETELAALAADDRDWAVVSQPGKVFYADPEAEGKPIPNWNRVTLTHIDPEDGALLRRRVAVPAAWRGRRILLRFDAVYPAGRFYCNGALLGEHMSGLTPVEFDVTRLAVPGQEALIAVRLLRRHTFVQMDMPRHAMEFAGLAQSATLFAVEAVHVADYHLVTGVDLQRKLGSLRGTVTLANTGATSAAGTLRLAVATAGGETVADVAVPVAPRAGSRVETPLSVEVEAPALWNDEFPTLYHVTLKLALDGQPAQTLRYRTGFRCLELGPAGARLNGNPVKFRGVNHLTYHPDFGLHTPREWLRRNLTLMKRANVNAIRTHFLGPRDLADLCDELGIYLLQELPIDWGTDYIHDPEWVEPALLRIEGGVRRDRHHCSVMVWSVGNENMPKTAAVAEAGWNHLRRYEARVKELDPSRPTLFPPPGPANAIEGIIELRVGDIADTHYSFNHIKRFLRDGAVVNPNSWEADMIRTTREEALARGWSGVWFSSEYGLFNAIPDLLRSPHGSIIDDVPEDPLSGKGTLQAFEERLEREWGFMRDEPTCLGGAYFPWLCAGAGGAAAGNPWGWVRWGEDADWGVVTADLLPKPFFWALRVLFSPVRFPRAVTWQPGETDIRFPVRNLYNAIDLQDCTLRVQQNTGGKWMTMVRQFRDVPMRCAPGEQGEIRIPIWHEGMLAALAKGGFGLCRCSLMAPDGFRAVTADILVLPAAEEAKTAEAAMPVGPDAVLA